MENLRVVLRTRRLTRDGITSGRLSASNRFFVEYMPRISPEQKSRRFRARDMAGGPLYRLKYNRRMGGPRPKQTITGLRRFFRGHGVQPGDRITVYREEGNEVMLMGTLISPLYVIHIERVNEVADR
ncbi:hypothetical protein SLA2020_033110 [Shorea laevis]